MKRIWIAAGVMIGVIFGGIACGEMMGVAGAAEQEGAEQWARRPAYHRGFEVQVLVGGRPLEEHFARGRRYVEALEGAEYELRVRNPLPVRVAVALAVDGLNTIDARHGTAWGASKWVIMPYETITVGGWQMSSARARRFYFTTESDSYATRLGRPGQQGVISAVFFRERELETQVVPPPSHRRGNSGAGERESAAKDKAAPRSEQSARSHGGAVPAAPDDYAATGIGRSVRHDVRWVHLDLLPHPVAEVAIRYEYRPQLMRLGIIPRHPAPRPDPLDRRERARGFEDSRYSPEP